MTCQSFTKKSGEQFDALLKDCMVNSVCRQSTEPQNKHLLNLNKLTKSSKKYILITLTEESLQSVRRNAITQHSLCSDHKHAMADRASLSSMLVTSQQDLPARSMKHSFLEVHLPLGSEPELREKYLTFHNSVRWDTQLNEDPGHQLCSPDKHTVHTSQWTDLDFCVFAGLAESWRTWTV